MTSMNQKDILTTGEVARICHVAPRTVSKWFDTGKLPGYRIPGSRDRRIPRPQLEAFMRTHGLPLAGLDGGVCRVLAISEDKTFLDFSLPGHRQAQVVGNASRHFDIRRAANGFHGGVLAQEFRPHAIVLDLDSRQAEATAICRGIRGSQQLQTAGLIAAGEDLTQETADALLGQGFDACISKPVSANDLAIVIERVTELVT